MKAVRFEKIKKMILENIPKPEPKDGEVLVKIRYCAICGTDVSGFLNGHEIVPGTVPGHEMAGTIETVGKGVSGFKTGDRVVVGPPGSCQEQCYFCRTGHPNLCVNGFARTLGIGPGTQGGYAEYVLARYPQRQLVKIPDNVDFEDAVLFDVFATAYHGYRRSDVKAGDCVVVVGAGAIGLSMVQLLKISGARKIIVVDQIQSKLGLAKKFGADEVINFKEEMDVAGKITALCDQLGAMTAFECAGNPKAVATALSAVRAGGQVVSLGTNGQPLDTINEIQINLREINIKGSFCYDDEEIRSVLDLMSKGLLDTKSMISKMMPLEEAQSALETLASTPEPVRFVLIP